MRPIIPNATIRGDLPSPNDLSMLTQDLLEVELPNGVVIDVGWYPEHDPTGAYGIIIFQDDPDRLLREPYFTEDPSNAILTVQRLAQEIMQPQRFAS